VPETNDNNKRKEEAKMASKYERDQNLGSQIISRDPFQNNKSNRK